ncbi:IstB ATP binding domain-containing protein, partial [mine drainage metagenome]
MKRDYMLYNQTIEGLYALRLPAMANELATQREQASYQALSFEERLGLLVDKELTERENRRLQRYLKQAKLRDAAVVEDIDFHRNRGIERAQILSLAEAGWVKNHHNIIVVGPTGVGKTYLGCALANAAIRRGYSALYLRAPRMLDDLAIARVDGRLQ